MTDVKARLTEAADHLDYLYEGAKHIPTDLVHSTERRGLVKSAGDPDHAAIGVFFYGGAAEVFLTLGPAVLPLLSHWLRQESMELRGHGEHVMIDGTCCCPTRAALAFADHILKTKEITHG